jgi:hypothetical protein
MGSGEFAAAKGSVRDIQSKPVGIARENFTMSGQVAASAMFRDGPFAPDVAAR